MLLLHWPRETSSRKAQHDDRLPDYKFEEQNYDHILSSRPHEDDKSTCEFIITRLELIRGKVEDRNIEVFQAWFRRREISDTGSISISSIVEDPVVCKVAYGSAVDSLKKEDKHYTKLRELQGTCIPKIHGFFIGTLTTGVEIAVLVMEDCGAQLGSRLKFFPSNIRMAAFQSLLSVHRKGILHGDFKERNMLYRQAADGSESVTLTDFGESQDHECDFDFNQEINLWDKAPDKYLCGCIELYYAGQRADIWTPRTLNFLGEGIPSEWASGTLEQLIEQVWNWKKKNLRNFPSRTTPSIIVDEARMVHGEWKTWYENRIP